MEHFLAERYLPAAGRGTIAGDVERIRRAAAAVAGTRLVQTLYLPGDELCLHLFAGDSADDVARVGCAAELEIDRIRPAEVER